MGVSDAVWGQSPVAVVVPAAGAALTPDALSVFAQEHLARYKVPRRWILTASLPLTGSGKVWRAQLRTLVERGELC